MATHTIPVGDTAILPVSGTAHAGAKVYEYASEVDAKAAHDALRNALDNTSTPDVPFNAPDGTTYQISREAAAVLRHIGKCLLMMWCSIYGIPYIP